MKSLNTRKIAALAAGAALLGSALLGAGPVSFGNTELVNANGQPVAKVVVGEAAAASDGVAAANIAAVLGNRAFKKTEVTASVTGLDKLSCEVTGTGGCEVLSKSVTLELETPAGVIPAGAHSFDMYIDDYIDEDTKDRATDTIVGNPWTGSSSATVVARKIGGSEFTPLADYVVKDTQGGGEYEEEQYLYAKSDGVAFNNDDGDFRSSNTQVAYEVVFGTDGLPVCSDSVGGDWAYCVDTTHPDYDTDKATENHRVKIMYLGKEWIISKMENPTTTSGGKIKLAEESAYSPKLQIGDTLDLTGGYKLKLGDLKPASGGQPNDLAIFSVLNSAGEEVANQVVAAGSTTEIQADGNTFKVRVYQVAPGYTLTEKWAEVAVFKNELTLEDGKKVDDTDNKDWKVRLIWKDLDDPSPKNDRLHKIQLYYTKNLNINPGESLDIIKEPNRWDFTFNGLDLKDSDYVEVKYSFEGASSYRFNHNSTSSSHDASEDYEAGTSGSTTDKVVLVTANSKIFKFYDKDNNEIVTDEFVYAPTVYNLAANASWSGNQTVLVEVGGDYVPVKNHNGGNMHDAQATPWEVMYNFGGAEYPMWFEVGQYNSSGNFDLGPLSNLIGTGSQYFTLYITLGEDAGNNQADYLVARAIEKTADSNGENATTGNWDLEFDFSGITDGSDEDHVIYYFDSAHNIDTNVTGGDPLHFFGNSSTEIDETYYYTHRGSFVDKGDTGSSSYTINVAKKVGKLVFMYQSVGEGKTEGSVTTYSGLEEGAEIKLSDGSKLRVKSIDVKTGAAAGGTGTVKGTENVKAVLNVANVANLGERQDVPSDLVVLDSEAAGAETVIAVGGPAVNTVTKAIVAGTDITFEPGTVVVQEVETGKIVVAGYSADDTLKAAKKFISQLTG
ncbi:MAG: S-layer protein [Candidatus Micrarchaeia archaeon]